MLSINQKQRYLLSSLSGILMGISFPFTGSLFFLSFVTWVPLLILEEIVSKRRYRTRKVFLHAYISFFLFNLISTWWVYFASGGGAIMAIVANSLVMTLPFYMFHITKKHVGRKEGYLSLPIFWIGFEYLHLHWDLSWPWLQLGNTFSRVPEIVQWYSYLGVMGGTLWILIVNLIVFRIIQNVYFKKETWKIQTPNFYGLGMVILAPIMISFYQYSSFQDSPETANVLVVQPNIDPYNEKFDKSMTEQLEKIFKVARSGIQSDCDLVLAPETALAYPFYEENFEQLDFYLPIKEKAKEWKADFLIGASTLHMFKEKNSPASRPFMDGPGYYESYNSSLFMNEGGDYRFVHKSKLVLGVEKIPFLKYLPIMDKLAINLDGASGTLGSETEPQVLQSKIGIIAPVICYESDYGEFVAQQVLKGACLIAVITNDGWWGESPGYKQHMSFSRLRAIETRRYVARSANTGISGFIDAKGNVLKKSEYWKEDAIQHKVHLNKELTFYTVYGDILGRCFSFVSVLLILFTFVKRFKSKLNIGKLEPKKSV